MGFHIVFAVAGIGMPMLMCIAEQLWLLTGNPAYLALAKRWAKAAAILFAVGAVSGTVLSFELGLLWPKFMELAGPVIGMPFSLEGFAFFSIMSLNCRHARPAIKFEDEENANVHHESAAL